MSPASNTICRCPPDKNYVYLLLILFKTFTTNISRVTDKNLLNLTAEVEQNCREVEKFDVEREDWGLIALVSFCQTRHYCC